MVIKMPTDPTALTRLSALADALKPAEGEGVQKDMTVLFMDDGAEELLTLAELEAREGDFEQTGQRVLKAAGMENRLDVWTRKATKPDMVSCPNGDCNGKFPEGTDTCPQCGKAITWDGAKPSLAAATGSAAKKSMGYPLNDKASVRYAVMDATQKGMSPGNPVLDEIVAYATEQNLLPHLPESLGGQGLDWNADVPVQKAGETDKTGGMQVEVPTPPTADTNPPPAEERKDFDDDDAASMILQTAYDYPDTWISAISSLCSSFVSTLTGLDNMQDAQGQPGLGIAFPTLLGQLTAGIQAIYDASGEELEGEGVEKGFRAEYVHKAMQLAIQQQVWVQKAGKRHSKNDVSLIKGMHAAALSQHKTAVMLEPSVCTTSCPLNGADADADDTGTSASKGMRTAPASPAPGAPDAEAESLKAAFQAQQAELATMAAQLAELGGVKAKSMETEEEVARLRAELERAGHVTDGLRKARQAGEIGADPLADSQQRKQKALQPRPSGNVYEFGNDDEDHRVSDWRYG